MGARKVRVQVREQPPRYRVRRRGERPRVLIDTNIVLDLMLERAPWSNEAARLFTAVHQGECEGFLAAHAVATVYYVVHRARTRRVAQAAIADLLSLVQVVSLDGTDFQRALTMPMTDYEDALHAVAAIKVDAHWLVTRNHRDFAGAEVPVLSAGEVLAAMS